VDPDLAFNLNADPDPGSQTDADPCGSGSWSDFYVKKVEFLNEKILYGNVADPDPGSGAFLAPGFGIRGEQPGSYFLELRNIFWGLKYADPGFGIETARIRDGKKSDPGSGINTSDPQHCFMEVMA
jgi:hypothetical protein